MDANEAKVRITQYRILERRNDSPVLTRLDPSCAVDRSSVTNHVKIIDRGRGRVPLSPSLYKMAYNQLEI